MSLGPSSGRTSRRASSARKAWTLGRAPLAKALSPNLLVDTKCRTPRNTLRRPLSFRRLGRPTFSRNRANGARLRPEFGPSRRKADEGSNLAFSCRSCESASTRPKHRATPPAAMGTIGEVSRRGAHGKRKTMTSDDDWSVTTADSKAQVVPAHTTREVIKHRALERKSMNKRRKDRPSDVGIVRAHLGRELIESNDFTTSKRRKPRPYPLYNFAESIRAGNNLGRSGISCEIGAQGSVLDQPRARVPVSMTLGECKEPPHGFPQANSLLQHPFSSESEPPTPMSKQMSERTSR